jgi:hypothetical protein
VPPFIIGRHFFRFDLPAHVARLAYGLATCVSLEFCALV